MSWISTRGGRAAATLAIAIAAIAILAVTGTFSSCSQTQTTGRPSQAVSAARPGDYAWVMAKTFARTAKARPANTWGEIRARAFIFDAFQQYSYYPRSQEFIVTGDGGRVHSANIIAVKQGDTARQLIVGAHYDSAPVGEGYSDNATGIGLLLEMAGRLKPRATPYTLVFVAFGAEEKGMLGSRHYVRAMSEEEQAATLGMIDLDAVAGGEELWVTSHPDAPGWLRDGVLTVADQLGIKLATPPEDAPLDAGEADIPTDSRSFALAGIPTATLSSGLVAGTTTGVTAGERLWHTSRDTVVRIEGAYPGRVRSQQHDLARILEVLLTSKLEKNT